MARLQPRFQPDFPASLHVLTPNAATRMPPLHPTDIQIIGTEIAIRWSDGGESFIPFATLRANSPSASVRGERDIFGHQYGGEAPKDHTGVEVLDWQRVGNYAIGFAFSDGHNTGLYSYELLRQLGDLPKG